MFHAKQKQSKMALLLSFSPLIFSPSFSYFRSHLEMEIFLLWFHLSGKNCSEDATVLRYRGCASHRLNRLSWLPVAYYALYSFKTCLAFFAVFGLWSCTSCISAISCKIDGLDAFPGVVVPNGMKFSAFGKKVVLEESKRTQIPLLREKPREVLTFS